jgi:serine/threonine protein kinase
MARAAFERAVVLFPEQDEARRRLQEVRERLGGTVVLPGPESPLLPLRRAEFDAKPGRQVRGTMTGNVWEFQERLGEGNMGVVFRVKNAAAGKPEDLALKTYHAARAGEPHIVRRFHSEAINWIRLGRHPNIVQAFWAERLEGALCIVVEYVPGKSLRQEMRRGPLPSRVVLPYALELCDALLHARNTLGLIHRDVKPENCLITTGGALKLTDFGISTSLREILRAFNGPGGAYQNERIGTPPYEAPEQGDPGVQLDERADIHAFGITLAEMIAGERLDRNRIAGQVPFVSVPASLWELARQCVHPDREQRPRYLDELRRKLEICYAELLKAEAPKPPSALDPTVEEYQDRGAAFVVLGEYYSAVESYERALQLRSGDPALWAGLSAAHLKAGDANAAITAAARGIAHCGETSSLLNNKGQALNHSGKHRDALAWFDKALGLDPRNPLILCNRAEALWKLDRRDEALKGCDSALQVDPRFVRVFVMRANILSDQNRINEAYEQLQKAAQVDPQDAEVLFGLSFVLDRMARRTEALAYAESALAQNRTSVAILRHKAWLLLKLSKFNDSIACFDLALVESPGDIEALRGKCLALLSVGKRTEALELIRTATAIAPDNPLIQHAFALAAGEDTQR